MFSPKCPMCAGPTVVKGSGGCLLEALYFVGGAILVMLGWLPLQLVGVVLVIVGFFSVGTRQKFWKCVRCGTLTRKS